MPQRFSLKRASGCTGLRVHAKTMSGCDGASITSNTDTRAFTAHPETHAS
jgi:hypothetical protein